MNRRQLLKLGIGGVIALATPTIVLPKYPTVNPLSVFYRKKLDQPFYKNWLCVPIMKYSTKGIESESALLKILNDDCGRMIYHAASKPIVTKESPFQDAVKVKYNGRHILVDMSDNKNSFNIFFRDPIQTHGYISWCNAGIVIFNSDKVKFL